MLFLRSLSYYTSFIPTGVPFPFTFSFIIPSYPTPFVFSSIDRPLSVKRDSPYALAPSFSRVPVRFASFLFTLSYFTSILPYLLRRYQGFCITVFFT
ncbi:hypothetical protein BGY98DRAFT_957765 [Russula aff. rugulosa BPL654]|nr:hypothetical protein BGY98DRAFT_957765 [Russula aff. rugulosa BPL654]